MSGSLSPAEVLALKKEIFSSLHCAMPGNIVSYDPEMNMAVIQPAGVNLPVLQDVPVFMPVELEVIHGDPCLVVFTDFDMDHWLETGEAGEPASGRMHSLSDAYAFVGWRRRES